MHLPTVSLARAARLTTCVALALTAACAGASGGASAAQSGAEAAGNDVLGAERLQASTASNLYDAIQQLRPAMLTAHHLGTPDVYIGGVRQRTGLDRLRQLPVVSVAEVRLVPYASARSLPGEQSEAGALVVTLK